MNADDLKNELLHWKFNRYKAVNFGIGMMALLIYEFVARPYYRPYIYAHKINDFHVADTLGNTLGTIAAIFIPLAILTNSPKHGNALIKLLTIAVILYEVAHPLLGKPTDGWDILATVVSGILSYFMFKRIFKRPGQDSSELAN